MCDGDLLLVPLILPMNEAQPQVHELGSIGLVREA